MTLVGEPESPPETPRDIGVEAKWPQYLGKQVSISLVKDPQLLEVLAGALKTNSDWLGHGRDVETPGSYSRLELAAVWSYQHKIAGPVYDLMKQEVMLELGNKNAPKVEVKTENVARRLGLNLDERINEVLLLHGTKPDNLASILSSGLNERYSGGLFGHGSYLAEDAGKTDQYVTIDRAFRKDFALHEALYPTGFKHPRDVFYVLVCKCILGEVARTLDGDHLIDGGRTLWADGTEKRELASVPDSKPPRPYHALLAEVGGRIARYREFVTFHSDRTLIQYIIAYRRKR